MKSDYLMKIYSPHYIKKMQMLLCRLPLKKNVKVSSTFILLVIILLKFCFKNVECTENPLLKAYVNAQDEARDGMTDIANALNNIAASINRFCDVYERVNLDM
uniref:Uncharacterized protein n=1 Tax=Photinus pyralis TaxID=7054 RepID=A0A1Y1MP98_PHOPY